jgi:hypothetical protein
VESVLCQSLGAWDLLVVDDGSTDGTERLLASYADRLRYIRTRRRGVSAARNLGIEESRGEWLAFLDSDDLWLPGKLERQLQALEACPGTLLCYTDEIWIRDGRRVNPRARHRKYSGWILEQCLPLCIISPSSALIGRGLLEQVGGFDERLPACEDYDLWLRIALRHPVLFLEEKLIVKRAGHWDQLSRMHWGLDRFRLMALLKLLRDPILVGTQREAVIEEMRRKSRILAQGARKRGREGPARRYEEMARRESWEEGDGWEDLPDFPGRPGLGG